MVASSTFLYSARLRTLVSPSFLLRSCRRVDRLMPLGSCQFLESDLCSRSLAHCKSSTYVSFCDFVVHGDCSQGCTASHRFEKASVEQQIPRGGPTRVRTLRIVPRRAPVVLFESNQEPKSDFHQTTYLRLLLATMDTPEGDPHGASFFSVSGGSDGNLSYNSVSCAQISSEVRHYCVFDETHCSADVCCGGFLAVEATLFQPIPDTLQSISGVDPPHHRKLAVIYPRILDHRLSRVRSATDVFVLVDSLAEAFVCIHLGTAFLSLLRHARGQYRGRCQKLVCDFRLLFFSAR